MIISSDVAFELLPSSAKESKEFDSATVLDYAKSATALLDTKSNESYDFSRPMTTPFRSLRRGGIASAIGFFLGMILLALGNPAGTILLFLTGGFVGLSAYAFLVESGIEIVNPRYLVAFIVGTFGLALSNIFALILTG